MRKLLAILVGSRGCGKSNVRHDVAQVGILVLLYLVAGRADAQTLTTRGSFNGSNGQFPQAASTLSGIALNGGGGQTAPFVLQMSYDSDVSPGTSAADDPLYLAWLDPATGLWVNAVDGNVGTNSGNFEVAAYPNGDTTLGDWGVNTANQTVWAVVNHDGDFAVVPEPSTLALLAIGALGLVGYGSWRQRAGRNAAAPAAFSEDAPGTLSFPSRRTEATRRAA